LSTPHTDLETSQAWAVVNYLNESFYMLRSQLFFSATELACSYCLYQMLDARQEASVPLLATPIAITAGAARRGAVEVAPARAPRGATDGCPQPTQFRPPPTHLPLCQPHPRPQPTC
jgi:hypothetical protein